VTDNLAVGPSDFDTYSITAPVDPRLPGGGGYPLNGMVNVKPALFGVTNNFVQISDDVGDMYRHFHGVDLTLNVRDVRGITMQGGFSTGQSVVDLCDIRAKLPELTLTNIATTGPNVPTAYCHTPTGFLTQFRGLATYNVPRIDVLVSAVYQDKPGTAGIDTALSANYTVPNSQIQPSLGRPLSGGVTTATINLVAPGTLYGDRVRELDFRIAKDFNVGGGRSATVGVDIYNLTNSNVQLGYNATFIPNGSWLTPTEIMLPRMFRVSAEFRW
jgi:hypothetical protein